MSSVKNLLAMFENKGENSPPERGRSPGPNLAIPGSGADSPRPLSKIRTSFVAIEKDGRVGLQRDPSGDSSISRRRLSTETDGDVSVLSTENKPAFKPEEKPRSFKTLIAQNSIPESQKDPSSFDQAKPLPKKSNAVPVPTVTKEPPTPDVPSKLPLNPTPEAGKTNEKSKVKEAQDLAKPNRGMTKRALENGSDAKETTPVSQRGPSKTAQPKSDALTISTSRQAAKPAVKSPGLVKGSVSKTRAKSPAEPEKTTPRVPKILHPEKTPQHKDSHPPRARTPLQPAKQPAASVKKPPPIHTSPPAAGFVKPRPKSPTKPVKLPASLMAPTASSVSKNNGYRPSLSTASIHTNPATGRSPSRASAVGPPTTKPQRPLKRQSSVINRPRPSLGPPPKQTAKDHPITRKEKEIDEGFLARMMRPTQSFAQKVNEKVPITPPRKPAAKRQGVDYNHPVIRRSASTKKAATSRESSAAPESKASDEGKDVFTPISKTSVSQVASVCEEPLASPPQEEDIDVQTKEPNQGDIVLDTNNPSDKPTEALPANEEPTVAVDEPNAEQPKSPAPKLETVDVMADTAAVEDPAEATSVGGDVQSIGEQDPAVSHEILESQGVETVVVVDSSADDTQVAEIGKDVEGPSDADVVDEAELKTEVAKAEETANAEDVTLEE